MYAIKTRWTAQLRDYNRKWLYQNKLFEAVIGWSEFYETRASKMRDKIFQILHDLRCECRSISLVALESQEMWSQMMELIIKFVPGSYTF